MADDFDFGGGGSGYLPQVQQAYANDPRQALISMMVQGTAPQQGRVVSPWSILSRALSAGVAAYGMNQLQSQYGDANRSATDTMKRATEAMGGTTDANGNVIPGDQNKGLSILASNPYTAPQALTARMQLAAALSKPTALRQGEKLIIPGTGQAIADNSVPLTDVGKLIQARDALPPGDPNRPLYDAQIAKTNQSDGTQYGIGANGGITGTQIPGGPADPRNIFGRSAAQSGGSAAGALPYAGAEAAAKWYATPHESSPGSTFVQFPTSTVAAMQSAVPGQVPAPRLLPPPNSATAPAAPAPSAVAPQTIYQNPNPAPGTQQGKLESGIGEQQAGAIDAWHKDMLSALGQNQELANMTAQLDAGLKTGTGFDARNWASKALTSLGIDTSKIPGATDPTKADLFDSGIKNLLIERAKAFGANPSNAEDKRIESSIVSASSPTEAVRAFMDWMRVKNDLKVQKYGEGYTAYKQRGVDPLQFDMDWAKTHGVVPVAPAAPSAPTASAPPAQAISVGTTARDPASGKRLRWNGSAWEDVK